MVVTTSDMVTLIAKVIFASIDLIMLFSVSSICRTLVPPKLCENAKRLFVVSVQADKGFASDGAI